MTVALVTYARNLGSCPFEQNQQKLNESALHVGFDKIFAWNREKLLDKGFSQYLDASAGDGYWSWKPFIILKALQENPHDIIVYWDVGQNNGNTFKRFPQRLITWCLTHGGMLAGVSIPGYGRNARWTHRDCFFYMECDSEIYWNSPQVQATFSIWHGKNCLPFLEKWIEFCNDPRVCTLCSNYECGLPNFPDFVEHRCDQSVLTNLCIKNNIEPLSVNASGDVKDMNLCDAALIQKHFILMQ